MQSRTHRSKQAGLGYPGRGEPVWLGVDALRFDDVEEQASALAGWNQEYLQLSQGAFEGDICQVQGAGVRVFVERVQQSVFQTGALGRDVLAVGIALDASGEGMFCGQACGADAFHVFSGESGFEFRTSRQHTMLGVELQIEHDLIDPALGQPKHQGVWAQAGIARMNPQTVAEIKTYLWALLQSARADDTLLANAAVGATVADFLLDRMAGEQHGGELAAAAVPCSHWDLVRQACTLMRESLDQVPTVARLCADLGVSRRTLQYGFARVLGVNPLACLKAVRLQQVRRALKQAKSVTEAATASGFWHFGHFSQDYQAMFGELPSATLRRARAGS